MAVFSEIVGKGQYFVFRSYSFHEELAEVMKEHVFLATEEVCGADVGKLVRSHGLSQMHKFVSPDFIIDIQDVASQNMKRDMLKYSGRFAKECLGLESDFYLDMQTIARVKFPFEVARKSTVSYLDYSKKKGRTSFKKDPAITSGYHGNLPFPAWCHGPHSDSYFGHSYDGINLWWAIDGVTEETGMTFYPQIICDSGIPLFDEPPYLSQGVPTPKPVFFDLQPGDVIAFNSDTLHGTRVNLSDTTRVSFSTRLNAMRPRFDGKNFRHVKYWLHSSELPKLDSDRSVVLPSNENCGSLDSRQAPEGMRAELDILEIPQEDPGGADGKKGPAFQTHYHAERLVREIPLSMVDEPRIEIGSVSELKVGQKMLVRFSDAKEVLVVHSTEGLSAVSPKCPHLGYPLIDAAQEGEKLFCAGHGIAFDVVTGKSGCSLFKLHTYQVIEEQGQMILYTKKRSVNGEISSVQDSTNAQSLN